MANIIEYIPNHLREYGEIEVIANVENELFTEAESNVKGFLDEQFIDTATDEGLTRWENMLHLDRGDTPEVRRTIIKSKLIDRPPFTIRRLKNDLRQLCGDDAEITMDYDNNLLTVKIALAERQSYQACVEYVNRVVPLHVGKIITLRYNTHQYIMDGEYMHGDLYHIFTHQEIKESEDI